MKEIEEKTLTDYEKFMGVAGPKLDEVTMVLRTHLLAEYYLDHILLANFERGDILLENRFSFSQKITILESLGNMRKDLLDSAKGLNSIRNDCAHSLDYKITERDIDKIGRPCAEMYLDVKTKHSSSTKRLLHWTLAILISGLQVAFEKAIERKKSK